LNLAADRDGRRADYSPNNHVFAMAAWCATSNVPVTA
jgi:hypothetical protein